MDHFFSRKITSIPGIEQKKVTLLFQELNLDTYEDLLRYYPFRYEDRTLSSSIVKLDPSVASISLQGYITSVKKIEGIKKRLVAFFEDGTGKVELVWFQNFTWVLKKIKQISSCKIKIWGKPNFVSPNQIQFVHPELTMLTNAHGPPNEPCLFPLYHTTDRLRKK